MVGIVPNHGTSLANSTGSLRGAAPVVAPVAAPRLVDVAALDAPAASVTSARADLTPVAQLERYADRVELGTTKIDDLVLHPYSMAGFERLEGRVREQNKILKNWAFATRGGTQPGVAAAFEGGVGLGKSLAARVLAVRLDKPLYEVDFAKVVGDTGAQTLKNLAGAIDAAAMAGAVLLIENVDALIVDAKQDRDARLLSAGLAQKLRRQAGVVVVTSPSGHGLGADIPETLTEKINFVYPEAQQRREIWKRAFPADTPVEAMPLDKLAQHQLTGAQISSAVLRAAALASSAGHAINTEDLKTAVRAEYQAQGRSSTHAEFNY